MTIPPLTAAQRRKLFREESSKRDVDGNPIPDLTVEDREAIWRAELERRIANKRRIKIATGSVIALCALYLVGFEVAHSLATRDLEDYRGEVNRWNSCAQRNTICDCVKILAPDKQYQCTDEDKLPPSARKIQNTGQLPLEYYLIREKEDRIYSLRRFMFWRR